jgi:hypothetical protein
LHPTFFAVLIMDELSHLQALASGMNIDITPAEDRQGESLVGTGGVLSTPSALPVAASGIGSESPRHAFSGSTDSSPVGLFVYDAQAGVEGPCGGMIGGTYGRFCCSKASACSVQSHRQKRFDATAGHAYIRCPRGTTAFCMPALNLEEVAIVIKERLECGGEESLQVWTNLFESLNLNRNEVAAVQAEIMAKCLQKVSWVLATPGKRPKFESSMQEEYDDVTEFPVSESALRMQKILEDSIEDVDAKVMEIRGTLGSTPSSDLGLPSPQVWPCLTSLCGEAMKVQALQDDSSRTKVRLAEITELRSEMLELKKANTDLQQMVSIVTKMTLQKIPSSTGVPNRDPNTESVSFLQKELVGLKGQVNVLQRALAETRARSDGQGVTIGGKVYHSPIALTEWVVENRANELPMEIWSDCISMFEQLTIVSMTSEKRTAVQTAHRKAGHKSVEMGLLINSFGTSVPALFQKTSTATIAIPTVTVAGSYFEWDNGDGMTGAADGIESCCEMWEKNVNSAIASVEVPFGSTDYTQAGRALATVMTTKSREFWTKLRGWIGRFHGRLMAKAMRGPAAGQPLKDYENMVAAMRKESWDLICLVLQDIFTDFLKVRMVGNPAVNMKDNAHRTATVIYALLKGQHFMGELLAAQIERHPCLSPSLNNFCIAQRASLADVNRVEAKANYAITLHNALKAEVHAKKK